MKLTQQQISKAIIKMADEDQKERLKESPDWNKIEALDKKNNKQIEKIVNEYGLIGIKEYGKEASYKAWLLIQHMPEKHLQFMKKYLILMKENLDDVDKANYAYLSDRVSVYENIPQTYGTQLQTKDDTSDLKFHPIKNIKIIDEKRKEVGLDSLKSYAISMEKMFNQKVIVPKQYKVLKN